MIYCCHDRRSTLKRGEFDFAGTPVRVHVDHGADVACFEMHVGQSLRKHHAFVFFDGRYA